MAAGTWSGWWWIAGGGGGGGGGNGVQRAYRIGFNNFLKKKKTK